MITSISQISLLLFSLNLISLYDCRQHGYDPNYLIGSKQANRFYYENLGPPALMSGDENKGISKIIADRPYEIQGSNKRSVSLDSEAQRTQKEEMKRFQDEKQVDETVLRTVNGLIKIVNLPKRYSSLINKRGQLDERRPSDDSVVIPAPPPEPRLYVPEISESCKRMKICDDVTNYPRELADKFFAELGDKRDMFNIDKETEVEQRKYSADQSNELCRFTEKVVLAAPSVKGDWYYVIYDEKSPLLNYRVKICNTDEGNPPCSPSMVHFFKGYKGTCRQNRIIQKMVVFEHNGNINYNKTMKVPSGCSCMATFVGKKKN